jgi:hypothetical protein
MSSEEPLVEPNNALFWNLEPITLSALKFLHYFGSIEHLPPIYSSFLSQLKLGLWSS